jgi:cell division protein FtsQ
MSTAGRSKNYRPDQEAGLSAGGGENRLVEIILRSLLAGLLSVNMVLALLLIYTILSRVPYFNVQRVDVMGNRHLSQAEVIEAAEVEKGANLLTIDLGAIAERLKRSPWIRSASVYRRFPGQLAIEIQERRPTAVLAAEKLYYVDSQGEAFTRLLPGDSVHYPLLVGVTAEQLRNRRAEITRMAQHAQTVLDLVERSGPEIAGDMVSEVHLDLDQGLMIRTIDHRKIVLGTDRFAEKLHRYARLKRFLTRRGRWQNARHIDLDFEDRALVRPAGAPRQG